MQTTELASEASRRLRGMMTPAASLVMILLLMIWGLVLAAQAFSIFLSSMFSESLSAEPFATMIPALFCAVGNLLVTVPLWMNAKRWFFRLDEGAVPLCAAFFYVSSLRRYRTAFWFSAVQTVARFLAVLVCLLPAAIMWAALRVVQTADVFTLLAVIMDAVLFLLGLGFSYYLLTGLFLTDYLFIVGYTARPLQAMRRSFQLMQGHRGTLFCLLCNLIPYFLMSLTVVTLPLTVPHIESCFAVWAGDLLKAGKAGAPQYGGNDVIIE